MNYMATKNTKITPETENQTGTPTTPEVSTPISNEQPKNDPIVENKKDEKKDKKETKLQGDVDIAKIVLGLQQQIEDLQKQLGQKTDKVEMEKFLQHTETKEDVVKYETKRDRMKAHLAEQPKVRMIIPLEGKEVRGKAFETVILNGYRLNIPKGVYVDLPEQVAEVLNQSNAQIEEALHNKYEITEDRRKEFTDFEA